MRKDMKSISSREAAKLIFGTSNPGQDEIRSVEEAIKKRRLHGQFREGMSSQTTTDAVGLTA